MKAVYVKTTPESLISVSRIVTVHYYEFDKSFVFSGERHDFWEMVYVDSGQVEVTRGEERLTLSQGELIFHKPGEFHAIRARDSAPSFFVMSFVSKSPAMACFEEYHTRLVPALSTFIPAIIREAEASYEIPRNDPDLRRLVRREDAPVGGEQLVKTYLEQLLVLLIREMTQNEKPSVFPSRESMESHLVKALKRKIEEEAAPVRVGTLCASLGYSESYLGRLFRAETGETIAAYAVKARILRARRLIREGEYNFAEISDRLGFDNPQYFSRVFKRVTGMTPSAFKQSLHFKDDAHFNG